MKKDLLTGNPIDNQDAIKGGGGQHQAGDQVWKMVFETSQGLSHSDQAVLPGGAYPQVPGIATGTEVYQWFDLTSNGIGYSPGDALVSTPFFPLSPPHSAPWCSEPFY